MTATVSSPDENQKSDKDAETSALETSKPKSSIKQRLMESRRAQGLVDPENKLRQPKK
jgi:hypothetical protein